MITVLSGGLIIKDSRGNPQVMRNGHTVAKLNGLLENMAAHIYCSKIKSQVWIACWLIQVKNTSVMYFKQPPCCKTCTEFHILPLKMEKKKLFIPFCENLDSVLKKKNFRSRGSVFSFQIFSLIHGMCKL